MLSSFDTFRRNEQQNARRPRNNSNSTAGVDNSITIINSQEEVARPSERF